MQAQSLQPGGIGMQMPALGPSRQSSVLRRQELVPQGNTAAHAAA
jgi:hypothetical protein